MPGSEGTCLNCDATLHGRYCHECGQEATELRVPLRALLSDALGDLFSLDSRILRTLHPLLFRPGRLTVEWVQGRRARYVPPLRLYIFVAAALFFTLALTNTAPVKVTLSDEDIALIEGKSASGGAESQDGAPEAAASNTGPLKLFAKRLYAAWTEDPKALQDEVIDRMGTLSLALGPVLALIIALFYRRRLLVEHMVFSFHVHSFAFILRAMVAPLPMVVRDRGGDGVALVASLVYLFVALRRVYGGGRWGTAARLTGIGITYLLTTLMPCLLLAMVWAVMTD